LAMRWTSLYRNYAIWKEARLSVLFPTFDAPAMLVQVLAYRW